MTAILERARAQAEAKPDLGRRALSSAFWALGMQATSQLVRLANNLVLARLLFDRAFGLIALVNICIEGMRMLTDVGIQLSVIRSQRAHEKAFLDTAWTIHVLRGVSMWIVLCALAWPLAQVYSEPELTLMLPVAGLATVIEGFQSLALMTASRDLRLRGVAAVELGTQIGAVALTCLLAWQWASPWALVAGLLIGAALRTGLSYALSGSGHGFRLERAARAEVLGFGRFAQLSSVLTFLGRQLDRLLLGRVLSVAELGVYNIAWFWSASACEFGVDQAIRVGIPALAEAHRTEASLYSKMRKMRLMLVWPVALGLCLLSAIGEPLVRFLYKAEFHEAGWMLRLLAAGGVVFVLNVSAEIVWVPLGDARRMVHVNAARFAGRLTGLVAGYTLGGKLGLVAGAAVSELLIWPLLSFWLWKRRLWQPEVDLPVIAVCASLLGLALL